MYFIAHLTVPAIAALLFIALEGSQAAEPMALAHLIDNFVQWYLFFAAPHLAWSVITSYFDARKATTVGGFLGGHVLLFGVILIFPVFASSHAGAFLYLPISPVAFAAGALIGRRYFTRQARFTA
ncbi:MAG: hypothetical protein HZC22_19155 [Rhodocyclales bacterium]|nr:hypothetical protein [Rhodocyclales bacterium]